MKSYSEMNYHPMGEQLVGILKDRIQQDDDLYFRLLVGYYFSLAAAQMRCVIHAPDKGGDIPINMFLLNLAPTGFGKTMSMNLLETDVLGLFRTRLMDETFPLVAEKSLLKLAMYRAAKHSTDLDSELKAVTAEYNAAGKDVPFSFAKATEAAILQLRHKLLMLTAGSINLVMDEVGSNMVKASDMFDAFVELYDIGQMKTYMLKNTSDNKRNAEILGKTPTNLLMFGVPSRLFDGGLVEETFMAKLDQGYARRCFFGYVRSRRSQVTNGGLRARAEQMYDTRVNSTNNQIISDLSDYFERLADVININKKIQISRDNAVLLYEYQLQCEDKAAGMRQTQELQQHELVNRHFKAMKLAGAYAFVDQSPDITEDHIYNAIKLTEDSGEAFQLMMARDKKHMKLAKYIAAVGEDVNHSDLTEDLPFYKGTVSAKQDMLNLAISWGYKNNIIIKRSFENGIEHFRGETLKATDLNRMVVSWSTDMTTGYANELAPWEKLHIMTQADGVHWVAHHLQGNPHHSGGYRNEENAIPGFNIAVIDIDGGVNLSTAQLLLKDYKFLMYTTKRHTDDEHRFRILLPLNYELKLEAKEYKELMTNIFDWLPFEIKDRTTNQRAKKWLSHPGQYFYNDGVLLDALPFIPKTSKNEERKQLLNSQQSLDNLERWVLNNSGDGNRNNMLLRYAMILLDAGFDFEGIRSRVVALNDKMPDKLDEAEIMGTILVTVAKNLAKRS